MIGRVEIKYTTASAISKRDIASEKRLTCSEKNARKSPFCLDIIIVGVFLSYCSCVE